MSEEHDSWFSSIGVDINALKAKGAALVQNAESDAKAWVDQKVAAVKSDVQSAETWAKQEYDAGKKLVADEVDGAKKWIGQKVDEVKQDAASVKQTVVGDQSGKPVPRPMEADCKPEHGRVPGPKNHLYCGAHGHVIDTDAQQIIAASIAAYVKAGLGKGGSSPAPGQPGDGTTKSSAGALDHIDPTGTLDFPFEVKGPKTAGVVKVNRAYFKASVKISVSGAPDGDVNVGPTGGAKSSDGKTSGQVGVTAEAKKTAQTELTKKFDEVVNSLVKSVTDKDGAIKTELFAKAKAEAKGGSKEASARIGYDFGVDATVFGMGKGTLTVKFTLVGLKYKPGDKKSDADPIPLYATVLSADVSQKVGVKWKKAFQLGQSQYDIEGSVEWGAEFEPNWAEIAKDAAEDVVETTASAAIMTAIDAAALAGAPLLAGMIIAQGIYAAGEKGERDRAILDGALDARSAALQYANTILGSPGVETGPRSKAAIAQAMRELKQIASSQNLSVDDVMTELRKLSPNPDFGRIYAQARQQIFSAYYSEVTAVIKAWRDEHYVLAAWTTEADDIIAVNKLVDVVFQK